MRKLTLEDFKKAIGKELANLPIEITKRGKTIAYIVTEPEIVKTPKSLPVPSKNAVTLAKKAVSLADAPKTYPKHGGIRLGDHYSCGCSI